MILRIYLIAIFFGASPFSFANEKQFFARLVHPLDITEDGSRILALNTAESRLSVFAFDNSSESRPLLIDEIPVGLLPVSVRLRTADEAWVVNELSDSVSIVSLSKRAVIATIPTGDEPGDILFADGRAFVTCSRDNSLQVFDVLTREHLSTIPLQGVFPRHLALSPDGTKLYVSFLHTSNGTTILPRTEAPPQTIPENINPDLPAPPQVAQIVPVDHPEIDYNVLDHDLAIVNPFALSVTEYRGNLGTNILSLASLPNGDLLAGNSEARNLISLEPNLRARFATSRIARISPGEHLQILPNPDPDTDFPDIIPNATAMSQIMSILPEGASSAWLASFGSDRIARLDLNTNTIADHIDLRSLDAPEALRTGSTVRGPRGLARHPNQDRLFVLNRLSHTLATIDTDSISVLDETPLASHEDLEDDLKLGRAFLFDTRLSANGSVSCATCHIDLERDGVAWDLGDPTGEMLTIPGALLSLHLPTTYVDRELHPMKGPLITQTLIGLSDQLKLHWRGDKPDIQSFNSTFPNLLAADELPSGQMDLVADYLLNLKHHPNPHLKLDRTFPDEIAGGNPLDGISVFTLFDNHCAACHQLSSGTSNNLDIPSTVGSFQALKDAPLRTTYHRNYFNPTPGASSLSGFGLGSDGSHHELPIAHPYSLHILDNINRPEEVRAKEKRDLTAFILAFDTGTAPAMGHSLTLNADAPPIAAQWDTIATLEEQTDPRNRSGVALTIRGIYQSKPQSFLFDPATETYRSNSPLLDGQTAAQLISGMLPGDTLTFVGLPLEDSGKLIDRNQDTIPDDQHTAPSLHLDPGGLLSWPDSSPGWYPESSPALDNWAPLTLPIETTESHKQLSVPPTDLRRFYRLRRTW